MQIDRLETCLKTKNAMKQKRKMFGKALLEL